MNSSMLLNIQSSLAQIQAGESQIAAAMPLGANPTGGSFTEHIGGLIRAVDDKGHEAQAMVSAVETGQSDNLVGAMLKSQEASLNFQMMMQVRNKVMSGLDDLIKLPI